jgi:hypothetical protein
VLAGLAILAGSAAWLGGDANARLAAAMLAAPLLVDFVLKPRRLHTTELRVAPRRTIAGAPFDETIVLIPHERGPLRDCVLTEPNTMRYEAPALLPTLASHQPTRVVVRQRSTHRSHALERVFVLASQWPFGLLRARAVLRVASELITEPARVPLDAELVRATHAAAAAAHDRSALPGPEYHSLREHLPDEDARAVHALRSASLGTLVRRVTQGRLPDCVGIVLDLRRPPGRLVGKPNRRFEWSLGACAALLATLRRHSAEALVLVLAEEPARLLVRGPAQETELLTLLAQAGPCAHRPLPPELFAAVQQLEHCFWVPAGAYLAAPEFAAMPGSVTLVGAEDE